MSAADERVEQIRARLAVATPGPWEAWQNKDAEPEVSQQGRGYMGLVATPSHRPADYGRSNADLIANAPADLAFLLAERTELLRRVEQAERAGAVKALEDLAETNFYDGDSDRPCDGYYDLIDRAIAFKNGADL